MLTHLNNIILHSYHSWEGAWSKTKYVDAALLMELLGLQHNREQLGTLLPPQLIFGHTDTDGHTALGGCCLPMVVFKLSSEKGCTTLGVLTMAHCLALILI